MTLTESRDPKVRGVAPNLETGKKSTSRDVVANVQQGKGGVGLRTKTPTWQRVTPSKCRTRGSSMTGGSSQILRSCETSWMRWESLERSELWEIG